MIKQYVRDEIAYIDGYDITNIEIKGDVIQFESRSPCGTYHEKHQVELLDVIAWQYLELLKILPIRES